VIGWHDTGGVLYIYQYFGGDNGLYYHNEAEYLHEKREKISIENSQGIKT